MPNPAPSSSSPNVAGNSTTANKNKIQLILTFLGFVAVSAISINGYSSSKAGGAIYGGTNHFTLSSNTMILFAFVLAVAFALSWAYLLLARIFTKQFIWVTGILNIALGIGTGVYYLLKHNYAAGIVFIIFGAFSIFCFITWIPRIPFSVLMLQTSIDVARGYGHVFLVSAVGGAVALAFGAWYSVTFVAVYAKFQPNANGDNPACSAAGGSCSYAKVIGLIVFITFAM